MPVTWSDEKLILLYCPGRGSNSRPSARRSVNMINVSHALTSRPLRRSDVDHHNNGRVSLVVVMYYLETQECLNCISLWYNNVLDIILNLANGFALKSCKTLAFISNMSNSQGGWKP